MNLHDTQKSSQTPRPLPGRTAQSESPSEQSIRTILVYGAGVLGSLYAGKLHQAGYDVTLLARGKRLEELNTRGLVLAEGDSQRQEILPVHITDRLAPEDAYDLVLVIVRKNQLASVLPALAGHRYTPNVLFMVNSAEGPEALIRALGRERVLLGFPGAGGQRVDGVVRYHLTHPLIQKTTIGEPGGDRTERIQVIAQALSEAGFSVEVSVNMDAWLKTHVAVVSPVANALYLAGGDTYRLSRTRDGLVLMVRAIQEGLRGLNALGVPITPGKYRLLPWVPEPLLVAALKIGLATPQAELVLARHANAARDEMAVLAEDFHTLVQQANLPTPAIDALDCYRDPAYPILPDGQANLKLIWGPLLATTGALVSLGLLAGWLLTRRRQ